MIAALSTGAAYSLPRVVVRQSAESFTRRNSLGVQGRTRREVSEATRDSSPAGTIGHMAGYLLRRQEMPS
ncbi:MAG: hypothetical protein IJQ15_04920 [Synergistaceae bacterium]|nr:hypothetical protein [Synergistaceae bacterium]MBQ6981753.1 hypothetical protein [Synergistaceae bacterium]